MDEEGTLTLMDEVLTPDSSRFWPADQYKVGTNPPSFDKQFVRDWLEQSGWNKKAPAPKVPADVIQKQSKISGSIDFADSGLIFKFEAV